MPYLIDTHAVLWFLTDDAKLPEQTKKIIEVSENKCYVSIVSFWEIAIKYSLGRLELQTDLENIFQIIEKQFDILPLTPSHILTSSSLDFHHKDPFDRILIAQAKAEFFTLISKDKEFGKYGISLVW